MGFAGLDAVLLDVDQTLVDRDAAVRGWLDHHGPRLGFDPGALRASAGRSLVELGRQILAHRPEIDASAEDLAGRIRAEIPAWIEPDEAVVAALDRLGAAGLRLAIVSNGGGATQRAKLAAAGLGLERFVGVWISGEVGVAKPRPGIFEAALAALGCGPERALMIGDALVEDVGGAEALGLRSCWIARGRGLPEGCRPPTFTVEDFPAAAELALDLAGGLMGGLVGIGRIDTGRDRG